MESYRRQDRRLEDARERKAASRLIRKDGPFQLWDIPELGEWWTSETGLQYIGMTVRWTPIEGLDEAPVRQGDVVLDCGGATGASTFVALSLGARHVVTIEPDPDNLTLIRRNLAEEIESGRVIVFEGGVWDHQDKLYLKQHLHGFDGTIDLHEGIPVELTTIDRLVSDLGLERVDFIKMDIEGSEQRALRGARETIRRFKPRMAVGAYQLPDDYKMIPHIVQEIRDDYQRECTRCLPAHGGMIIPNLMYFH